MWEYAQPISSDELAHYGVLGMKWGVRRYQNTDGTLTKAGQRRVGKIEKGLDKLDRGMSYEQYKKSKYSKVERLVAKEIVDRQIKELQIDNVYDSIKDRKIRDLVMKERHKELVTAALKDVGLRKISDLDIGYADKWISENIPLDVSFLR